MLREILDYYLTPATRQARRDGFVYEAVAFESRGRRLAADWKSHWDHCHKIVNQFCSDHVEAESVAILGTGCLFEIPKDSLLQRFQKIYFVDQVFPRSVRKWIAQAPFGDRIELHELDLVKTADLNSNFHPTLSADLMISANLLSQLPLARVAQRARVGCFTVEESDEIRRRIQKAHLEMLKPWRGRTLLWSDLERRSHDRRKPGEVIVEQTVFSPLPKCESEWLWHLAPAPEVSPFESIDLAMQSFRL